MPRPIWPSTRWSATDDTTPVMWRCIAKPPEATGIGGARHEAERGPQADVVLGVRWTAVQRAAGDHVAAVSAYPHARLRPRRRLQHIDARVGFFIGGWQPSTMPSLMPNFILRGARLATHHGELANQVFWFVGRWQCR